MALRTVFTKTLGTASATSIAASQGPVTGAFTINGSAATAGVATIDTATASNSAIGRRVIITSGGDDSSITFTVAGTNGSGNKISDTFAGANGVSQSNLDFVTVTAISSSAATASTVTAGTNGVGSSPWVTMNWRGYSPMNIGMCVELVSGSANFTIQHTYDDPNNLEAGVLFPLPFNSVFINAATATIEGTYTTPLAAIRLLINSGTGELRARLVQAGAG